MTEKEAKEYLMQYRRAARRVDAAAEHLAQLRAAAERITPNYAGGGGSHAAGDRLGEAVAKIVDAETRTAAEIDRMTDLQEEIIRIICAVEDARLRNILYRRYIVGQKWEEIAVAMHIEYRWMLRLHGRALRDAAEKIDH